MALVTPFNAAGAVSGSPIPYTYRPSGWRAVWDAALAAKATTPAWVAFITDSVGQGFYAGSDYMAGGFVGQLISGLKGLYPGEYAEWWPLADSVYVAPGLLGTLPWVVNDTTHANTLAAAPGGTYGIRWAGDAHPTATLATLTTPIACTAIDLLFTLRYVGAGATFTWTLDGGAGSNGQYVGTQTYTTPAQSNDLRKISLTGLANTTHTIVFTGQSVDNTFLLLGATGYPSGSGGTGLGYARMAQQGATANQQQSGGNPTNLNYQLLTGKTMCIPSPFGFPTQPHLAVVELGINDNTTAVGVAAFQNALEHIVDALRYGRDGASVLLVTAANPDPNASDIGTSVANTATYGQYAQAIWQTALAKNCALYDPRAKWGSTPVAKTYLDATGHGPHPTQAGHTAMAQDILSLLTSAAV